MKHEVRAADGSTLGWLEYDIPPDQSRLLLPVPPGVLPGNLTVAFTVVHFHDRLVLMTGKHTALDDLRRLPGWADA